MSNENEVYIIEDIHPEDGFYEDRDLLIGKPIVNVVIDVDEWIPGWLGISGGDILGTGEDGWDDVVFYAVKLKRI